MILIRYSEPLPVDSHVCIVIATRGHNHDLDAAAAALRTDAGFIGLLGSKRKKAVLFSALRERGFRDEVIGRINIPAGLPIGSITPQEIAVSIIAQIIQYRRMHAPFHINGDSCGGTFHQDGERETTPAAFGEASDQALP